MHGQRNLETLLCSMCPKIDDDVFVFCTLPPTEKLPSISEIVLYFRETEGLTVVMRKASADALQLSYQFPSKMITLTVHSALDAVGFLAAITSALAEAGISVNAVSAYYHDHLFVPAEQGDRVMVILNDLAARSHKNHGL